MNRGSRIAFQTRIRKSRNYERLQEDHNDFPEVIPEADDDDG